MGLEFIFGLMEEDMKVNGDKENNMVKENIYYQTVLLVLVYGKMEKELNGQMKKEMRKNLKMGIKNDCNNKTNNKNKKINKKNIVIIK